MTSSTMKMLDTAIVDLECRLGLKPGESLSGGNSNQNKKKDAKKKKNTNKKNVPAGPSPEELAAQPEICKLEFKVGVITKVWEHPLADKLYCEEIDVGEESGPRQIASGLRPHFSLEEMMGQRLLVVSNLKAKNLVKFKSHGMVLCAARTNDDGSETVEFVEPPEASKPGDVVSFEGLPTPMPLAPSQVDKKKIFMNCLEGLKTDSEGIATWKGHKFVVGEGNYCRAKSVVDGPMRDFQDNLELWDTSNVVDMSDMFYGAPSFNKPLSTWNTSQVTSMNAMFGYATSFNQSLSGWNTSKVTDMSYMFGVATSFNQSLSRWNTSQVTDMSGMFYLATSFNQLLSTWNTSQVTDMFSMFEGATSFGGNNIRDGWDITAVTNMNRMFYDVPAKQCLDWNFNPDWTIDGKSTTDIFGGGAGGFYETNQCLTSELLV